MDEDFPILTMSDDDRMPPCEYVEGFFEYFIQVSEYDETHTVICEHHFNSPLAGRNMKKILTAQYPDKFIFVEQRFY